MREFYKNSKRNTLRYIVFKNKTKQLPYLRLVPKNEIRFRKSKNTMYYSFEIRPNNEYHRYQSKYKDKYGKRRRWHEFSCVVAKFTIVMISLKQFDRDRKAKDISLPGRDRSRRYKRRRALRNISNKKRN